MNNKIKLMMKIIVTIVMWVAAFATTWAANGDRFYIPDFSISAGETKQVSLVLENVTTFSALQADITLPAGLSIEQEDGEYLFDLTDRKARNHTVSSTTLSTGAIRILIASQTSKTFTGNSGALVTFNITADASFTSNGVIQVKNVIGSEANTTQHNLPDATCHVTAGGSQPNPPVVTEDRFYIPDFSISAGETKQVSLVLENVTTFSALQADITLPAGLSIEQEDGEYLFDLTDRKARNHTVSSTTLSTGAIRILIASQTSKTFTGNSGALVTFNITADASFTSNGIIQVKNVIGSEANTTQHNLPDATCHVTVGGSSVSAITLNKRMVKLKPGESMQLSVVTSGVGNVVWSTEDSGVAVVDASGWITARKAGMVAITATAANGGSAWCAVFVDQKGDINDDTEISVADVTALVNMVMNQ